MKKLLKYSLISVAGLAVAIQAVPVDRSNPPVVSDADAPPAVKDVLRRSCYDCHSNETKWPWYSYIAPVSWLVSYDVNHGREYLNFSDWDAFKDDDHLMEEIIEEIEEGKMPLPVYLITHANARVSDRELADIKEWLGIAGETYDHDDH